MKARPYIGHQYETGHARSRKINRDNETRHLDVGPVKRGVQFGSVRIKLRKSKVIAFVHHAFADDFRIGHTGRDQIVP